MNSNDPNLNRPELYEEIDIDSNRRERERCDNLAELYSVLSTIQFLEKAYTKENIPRDKYSILCGDLLDKFKSAFSLVQNESRNEFPNIDVFVTHYRLEDLNLALDRVKEGAPRISGRTREEEQNTAMKLSMEIVENAIQTLDRIQLGLRRCDELSQDVLLLYGKIEKWGALTRSASAPESLERLRPWIKRLKEMKADDTISDEDAARLKHDCEISYLNIKPT